MRKTIEAWKIEDLEERISWISFPEYQRESNLWSILEKRRLIDSIMRQFDIASLYFYEHDNRALDCVDGRQRIGAIMSFLGKNPDDKKDDGFTFRLLNEISQKDSSEFSELTGKTFKEIYEESEEKETAKAFVDRLRNYEISVVRLSDSRVPEEFNLQFTRLNLGTIINSGEKLNAMVGDLRDECFMKGRLGSHPFLNATRIPTRRYSRQQVAAQILAQVFSLADTGEFTRVRHYDLQRLFKRHSTLSPEKKELVERVNRLLLALENPFRGSGVLRNRAITVSTVLLAWTNGVESEPQAVQLSEFIEEFQTRLRSQVRLGLDSDQEYRYLLDFQRNVTQASAEKPGFAARAETLQEGFDYWQEYGEIKGDAEWRDNHPSSDPREVSRGSA